MKEGLRIAVASGKGGTGKTTIATNLAVALGALGKKVAYVDCDVEEPNGHIFLNPAIEWSGEVTIRVPRVDERLCNLCGACGEACRHSAIVALPSRVLTFPKLCHGCGGCTWACPQGAISERPRRTGVVETGHAGPVDFVRGILDVGEAMAPPVIRGALDKAPRDGVVVLDAPPGTSCPVIETVRSADVVLLVTEPTPFGVNDLKLAVEMVKKLGVPFGVVVNRAGSGNDEVYDDCAQEGISVLLEIPDSLDIARAYSRGQLAIEAVPSLRTKFEELLGVLEELASAERVPHEMKTEAPAMDGEFAAEPVANDEPAVVDVPELVVVSGKGGTGKTSVVASFLALAQNPTAADCDVDAADLHLVLEPEVRHRTPFSGGQIAVIDEERCRGCGLCSKRCRFGAVVTPDGSEVRRVQELSCEGCGVCADACPHGAIEMAAAQNGEWFISDTRLGPFVHARLGIAQENSGKLVSTVRRHGRAVAKSAGSPLLICDGSPGIGCPVIASIAAARMVLVVVEPTLSGRHDLERVAELVSQFDIHMGICINKADVSPEQTEEIARDAKERGLQVLGRIRYDPSVTAAQVARRSVVEARPDGPAAQDIRKLWRNVKDEFDKQLTGMRTEK